MKNSNIKIGTNKSFGIVFFIFFLIVSIYPLIDGGVLRVWSLVISVIFLILGILNSKILTPLNKLWFKLGILLGAIVSPIVMGIVFFIVLTPLSFIVKLFGTDLLKLKFIKQSSYWINRNKDIGSMKKQF